MGFRMADIKALELLKKRRRVTKHTAEPQMVQVSALSALLPLMFIFDMTQ